ncbi:PREDICTED: BMP/retinoic acid-inducible neural-specific protein 1-like [Branchiostoma belcheri]|uniref:BMP/retinoic acid-inducible neural-specific protein 1-like n=1 Tax=Branchiostoma belcheri TaxID=7741 RepID=A0A6P5ACN1_BRABE|nr:PREDICTED: BMP/retinoic acid-inducible neural-specific protein 1-like [Branchiostoma belcheri]
MGRRFLQRLLAGIFALTLGTLPSGAGGEPDRGPLADSPELLRYREQALQGFSIRVKASRQYTKWIVHNLASHRNPEEESIADLDPGFIAAVLSLGERPSRAQLIETVIRPYGTHYVVSGALGGGETVTVYMNQTDWAVQREVRSLLGSYFADKDGVMEELRDLQRRSGTFRVHTSSAGPMSCGHVDDTRDPVLLSDTNARLKLRGLQDLLPRYLRESFTKAALSYIYCDGRGEWTCKGGECRCKCDDSSPDCACSADVINRLLSQLEHLRRQFETDDSRFEQTDGFQRFVRRLPIDQFLDLDAILERWRRSRMVTSSYRVHVAKMRKLLSRIHDVMTEIRRRVVYCTWEPELQIKPSPRSPRQWQIIAQARLYCSRGRHPGTFDHRRRACACVDDDICGSVLPCVVGRAGRCRTCNPAQNFATCGSCNEGYQLLEGTCRMVLSSNQLGAKLIQLESYQTPRDEDMCKEKSSIDFYFRSKTAPYQEWFSPTNSSLKISLKLRTEDLPSDKVTILTGVRTKFCFFPFIPDGMEIYTKINPLTENHRDSYRLPQWDTDHPKWTTIPYTTPLRYTASETDIRCVQMSMCMGQRHKVLAEATHLKLINLKTGGLGAPLRMRIEDVTPFGYRAGFNTTAIREALRNAQDDEQFREKIGVFFTDIRDRVKRLSPFQDEDMFSNILLKRVGLEITEVRAIEKLVEDTMKSLEEFLELI